MHHMNIRELREQNDMTQDDLANRLGIKYQSVSRWERGIAYPATENLLAMAEIFHVSVDVILGRCPIPRKDSA